MGDTKYPPEWMEAIKALYPCMVIYGSANIILCFTQEDHCDAAKAMCLIQGLTSKSTRTFVTEKYPYGISVQVCT